MFNKKSLWINLLIPIILYLIGLGVAIGFSLNVDYTAISDASREYEIYMNIVKTGDWHPIVGYPLSSCVTILCIPAFIQGLLHSDPLLTYSITHIVMVSFLPVVVYFLAKNYVNWKYSLISVGLLLAHPYSWQEPKMARTGIAVMFFTLLVLVMFSNKLSVKFKIPLLLVCVVGIVTSSYAITYATMFILGVSWLIIGLLYVVKRVRFDHKMALTVALCFMILASAVWLGLVARTPWQYAKSFVENSLKVEQFDHYSQVITTDGNIENQPSIGDVDIAKGFLDVSNREWAVQAAFGRTLPSANTPQKIEFVFSWLVVLTLTYGMFVAVKQKMFKPEYLVIACVSYFTILLTIATPYLSIYYSAVRVYFQVLVIIGICFIVGGMDLSKRLKLKSAVIPLFVLIPYALCTSGLMHYFFGISRWQ